MCFSTKFSNKGFQPCPLISFSTFSCSSFSLQLLYIIQLFYKVYAILSIVIRKNYFVGKWENETVLFSHFLEFGTVLKMQIRDYDLISLLMSLGTEIVDTNWSLFVSLTFEKVL